MSQALRPYQESAIAQLRAGFLAGNRRQVLVVPTGGGKTTIMAHIVRLWLQRHDTTNTVLFVAHRTELIEQASERLDQNGVSEHGIVMAGSFRHRPYAPVQVASIDTLAARKKLVPGPELVIIDECHRARATQHHTLLTDPWKGFPNAQVIGLTATPWRLDGRGLGEYVDGRPILFSNLVVGATYADLIGDGFILEPRVLAPTPPPDLSGVRLGDDGDYSESDLADLYDQPASIADIVRHWKDHGNGERTIVFATSVQHSKHIAEAFAAVGISAAHVDGTTPKDRRRETLDQLRSGDVRVVSSVAVLTEGFDCPPLSVAILARPTASVSLARQMVGRVLRPAAGKTRALVIDLGGIVERHGWPTADLHWSLADRPTKPRQGGGGEDEPLFHCKACRVISPGKPPKCPACGAVPGAAAIDLGVETQVPLVELSRDSARRRPLPPAHGPRRPFRAAKPHHHWSNP